MTKKTKRVEKKSRKKRCPNGSRRDKPSGLCRKYRGFSVFDELKDRDIKKDGTTISIESLEDAGVVIKVYHDGELKEQNLVGDNYLEKGRDKSLKDLKNIMKKIGKIKLNPDLIRKDRQFQIFKKNVKSPVPMQKGGGHKKYENSKETPSVNLTVQKNVLKKVSSKEKSNKQMEIQKLGLEIGLLKGDIDKEVEERQMDWISGFWIFNYMTVVTTGIIAIGPWLVGAWNILISTINDVEGLFKRFSEPPGVVSGFTPGVVSGFTPGVVSGFTPGSIPVPSSPTPQEEISEGILNVIKWVGEGIVDGVEGIVDGVEGIFESKSGSVPGSIPGVNPGSIPGINPGSIPGINPGSIPGINPGSIPGINPGSIPGSIPGSNPALNYIKENDVEIDFYVGISLIIIDMIAIRFPNETSENIVTIAQYLFWSWLITTSIISGGAVLLQFIPIIVGLGYSLWLKSKHNFGPKIEIEKAKEKKIKLLNAKLVLAQDELE